MEDGQEIVMDTTGVGSEGALRQATPFGSDVLVRLQKPATFTIEMGGNAVVTVERTEGGLRIDLGPNAAERVVLGDSFKRFFDAWLTERFDAHVHTAADGRPTTPPLAAFTGQTVPEAVLSGSTKTS